MEASFEQIGSLLVIAVSGRLDTVSAPRFDERVAPVLAEARKHILLDMSGVSYISSAGLRSVLHLVKHTTDNGGRVGLFSVPAQIMDVLEISGFPQRLDVYPDRASALKRQAS
jgi:anti-anti-sigma factor